MLYMDEEITENWILWFFDNMASNWWKCKLQFTAFMTQISSRKSAKQRFVLVTLNRSWLSMGAVVLIFDYIPLPTLTYSSRAKDIRSKLRRLFVALCDVREKRCCFEPAAYQKKEVKLLHNSPLSSCYLWQHWPNISGISLLLTTQSDLPKRKQPPIYTFIHLRMVLGLVGIK